MKDWHKVSIGILIVVGCLMFFANLPAILDVTGDSAAVQQEQSAGYKPATRDELFALVNAEREKAGVAPLQMDERLNQSAQWKADLMASTGNFDHQDPEHRNDGVDKAFETTGRSCENISENLRWGSGDKITAPANVRGWMNSQDHREAMLNGRYTLVGYGLSQTGDGLIYITQHLCDNTRDKKCDDVTSNDYNWNNDMVCTNTDGSRFYTSYGGADAFLAQ